MKYIGRDFDLGNGCRIALSESNLDNTIFLKSILSEQENLRFDKMASKKSQFHYALSRYTAKRILCCDKNTSIINQDSGAPIILSNKNLEFSKITISHSCNICAILLFNEPNKFGIDVEYVDYTRIKALYKLTARHEVDNFIFDNAIHLTVAWAMKEALSKACLSGLTMDYTRFKFNQFSYSDGFFKATFLHFCEYSCIAYIHNMCVYAICVNTKIENNIAKAMSSIFLYF